MKLDGPAWIVHKLREALAERRFFVCTAAEMLEHGDVACANQFHLVHVGERDDELAHATDRGWYRRYPGKGLVRGRPVRFITRSERGWLDSGGSEYLDHEVRQAETGS